MPSNHLAVAAASDRAIYIDSLRHNGEAPYYFRKEDRHMRIFLHHGFCRTSHLLRNERFDNSALLWGLHAGLPSPHTTISFIFPFP
jgi:hypothetical protein